LANLFCSASLLTLFTFCFEFSNEQQQPYKCTTEACVCMKQNLVCASVKILLCRFCFCFPFFLHHKQCFIWWVFSTFTIHLCNSFARLWQSMEKKIYFVSIVLHAYERYNWQQNFPWTVTLGIYTGCSKLLPNRSLLTRTTD